METTRYTLNALAAEVNERSGALNLTPQDQRSQVVLSTRRIRDYQSKGLIEKPGRDGKYTFYTEKHVTQLLALRSLQSEGLSERYIAEQMDLKDELLVNSYLLQKSGSTTAPSLVASGSMAGGSGPGGLSFARYYDGSSEVKPPEAYSFISWSVADSFAADSIPKPAPDLFTTKGQNSALNAINLIRETLPKTLSGSLRKSNSSNAAEALLLVQSAASSVKNEGIPNHSTSCREWPMAQGRLRVALMNGPPLTPEEQKQVLQHMQQILASPASYKP